MMNLFAPTKGQIKLWEKLGTAKTRRRENLFLAEGVKVVTELFKSRWEIAALLIRKDMEGRWTALEADMASRQVPTYGVSAQVWQDLSQDKTSEGIMAVVQSRPPRGLSDVLRKTTGHALFLDRINNPHNLGALMRTALWFGIRLILTSKGSVDFTHPKAVRASMGSFFHMNVLENLDFLEILPEVKRHFVVIGSEVQSGMRPHPCPQRTALMFGNESHGLPADLLRAADETWHVPGKGDMESLSLPQAAAVMLYECTRND